MTAIPNKAFSLRDLKLMAGDSTPTLINLDRLVAVDYEDQHRLVERAIDWCGLQIVENRHLKQDLGEDALTIEIVHMLKGMGYDAEHDTQIGGHCDVIVRGKRDFLWIGEAKIHKDYDWLLKGYEQLDSRYSTGQPGQDTGEIIIFSYNERIDKVVAKWIEHLIAKRPDVSVSVSESDKLVHYSLHQHPGTGRTFKVRHKPINLYWRPMDKEQSK
ncbi:MAG: hypothetical protein VR78_08830 [Hoeflea sp. BRH_c9]|nr:MAG: hypothetical protein VR78_08830 [Hoeflea sp. BRH_c9]